MATVDIQTAVALQEERQLTEHYRNRNLILAQAVADLRKEVERLTALTVTEEGKTE